MVCTIMSVVYGAHERYIDDNHKVAHEIVALNFLLYMSVSDTIPC